MPLCRGVSANHAVHSHSLQCEQRMIDFQRLRGRDEAKVEPDGCTVCRKKKGRIGFQTKNRRPVGSVDSTL
jgi:hypothetical protein